MAEKGTGAVKKAEYYPVEKLRDEMKVPDAVHKGTCIQMGWSRGKETTKKEYEAAVDQFKKAATGRRGHA